MIYSRKCSCDIQAKSKNGFYVTLTRILWQRTPHSIYDYNNCDIKHYIWIKKIFLLSRWNCFHWKWKMFNNENISLFKLLSTSFAIVGSRREICRLCFSYEKKIVCFYIYMYKYVYKYVSLHLMSPVDHTCTANVHY